MTHEEVLKKHGYKKQGSSNVFQHEGGHSVTVGQKGNWVHGKVIGGKNTEHTEGDSVSALDAHLGKFHWQRKTTHTNHDRKEILPVSEEPETSQHAEQSDVTQFTEQVLPTAAVVPAMQQSHQFSEPFSTFGSRLAASKTVHQFNEIHQFSAYRDFINGGGKDSDWEAHKAKLDGESAKKAHTAMGDNWKAGKPIAGINIANHLRSQSRQLSADLHQLLQHQDTEVSKESVTGRGVNKATAKKLHKAVSEHMNEIHKDN